MGWPPGAHAALHPYPPRWCGGGHPLPPHASRPAARAGTARGGGREFTQQALNKQCRQVPALEAQPRQAPCHALRGTATGVVYSAGEGKHPCTSLQAVCPGTPWAFLHNQCTHHHGS